MKGWRAISRVTPLEYLDVSQVTAEKPILESYEKELRSLLEKCKKENLNVLFVATPWDATEEEQQMEHIRSCKECMESYCIMAVLVRSHPCRL